MKKYFVVSDVHGFYDELIESLTEKGFDINNQDHILISCGDLLDRGDKPFECLCFVNKLYSDNRAILIRGNHEDLMEDAISRGCFLNHDVSNGTARTAFDLTNGFNDYIATHDIRNHKEYNDYINSCIDFYETTNHVFVHGWIPFESAWRNGNWSSARWTNGMEAWLRGARISNKQIVCGHWHTSWGHSVIENKGSEFCNDADFSPFIHDGIIALDACTAFSHKVNCLVIEGDKI